MTGCYLRFYVSENQRHQHRLSYEWLLEEALRLGLPGGSAFRALAGFGRHGRLHAESFIELAGDLPVEVGFVLSSEEADRFLAHVSARGLDLFYLRVPVQAGFTGSASGPQPAGG
jgi:PII-like signaling protein